MNNLSINLNAIRQNYQTVLGAVDKNKTAIAPVVKADAYGLGMAKCAKVLYQEGARIFFVATIDEALELKDNLKNNPDVIILVLHGLNGITSHKSISMFAKLGLIPVLNNLAEIELWQENAQINEKKYDAVLHIDTGMNRLGLSIAELNILQEKIHDFHNINFLYVMSHLACADEINNIMTEQQLKNFLKHSKILPTTRLSLANSAGIFYDKKLHFDLVRPGIALYGAKLHEKQPNMKPVMYLDTTVLDITEVKKGDTVGYGATYQCKNKTNIATIPVGYAHGLFRNLSNKGHVYIMGKKAPIIGRISMDLITIDITHIKEHVKLGDKVEILGDNQKIEDLAKISDTIPYEILTSIGKSFNKYYIDK